MINPANLNKSPRLRNIVSKISNSETLLPVIFLESTVTAGRAYQAYKRDKKNGLNYPIETQERLFEDVSSALFWLGGAWGFNKIGDFIGKNFLGIKYTDFDVGKDNVRTPFENLLKDNPGFSRNKYSIFKFGKIITSVALATGVVGFLIPKIKRDLSRKAVDKNNHKNTEPKDNFELFINNLKPKQNAQSFTRSIPGAELLNRSAHNMENHPIYRLLATDTGIVSGRNYNAKDNDERIEITFRDATSVYFYLFSTKHAKNVIQKFDSYSNLSKLNVDTALELHNYLLAKMNNTPISALDFGKKAFGKVDNDIFKNIPTQNGIISLEALKDYIPENLHKKAGALASLQPEQVGLGKILTQTQVQDLLNEGWLSDENFIKKIFLNHFGKTNGEHTLTRKYSFVAQSKIENLKNQINNYVEDVIKYANENNSGNITKELMETLNKRNLMRNGVYSSVALGISALFLSTIIPKVQYAITRHRTGKDCFPGLEKKADVD